MPTRLLRFAGLGSLASLALALFAYAPDKPRAELEAAYPGEYRSVDGVRLRLRDTGPRGAPTIILLHGFGASLDTWEPWAEALSDRFRVVRFDLPGFGLTGPDPTGDYSDAREAKILADLMDALGVARAGLVGNSMGGRIAMAFAAGHPDRVTRMALVSPASAATPTGEQAPGAALLLRALPFVAPRVVLRAALAAAYAREDALSEATLERYRDLLLAPGVRQAIVARAGQLLARDADAEPRPIDVPTLLLWGERDRIIPVESASAVLRDLPRATLVTLPNLGHVPFEEDPAASIGPLERFLSAGEPAGTRTADNFARKPALSGAP